MTSYQWKDGFNTGIDEIDQQHRLLLKHLNDCHLKVSTGRRSEIGRELLDGLKRHAVMHFRLEESLMRAKGYPKLDHHEQQHKYFESQILEFENEYAEGTGRISATVLAFLRDWFLKHILEQDKEYVPYLE